MCFLFFCLELLEGFQNMSYDSLIRIYIYTGYGLGCRYVYVHAQIYHICVIFHAMFMFITIQFSIIIIIIIINYYYYYYYYYYSIIQSLIINNPSSIINYQWSIIHHQLSDILIIILIILITHH